MSNEKKQEKPQPKRQIIIETDGRNIEVVKSEVMSQIEFVAILQAIVAKINQQQ